MRSPDDDFVCLESSLLPPKKRDVQSRKPRGACKLMANLSTLPEFAKTSFTLRELREYIYPVKLLRLKSRLGKTRSPPSWTKNRLASIRIQLSYVRETARSLSVREGGCRVVVNLDFNRRARIIELYSRGSLTDFIQQNLNMVSQPAIDPNQRINPKLDTV